MIAVSLSRAPRFIVLILLLIATLGAAGILTLPRLEDPTLSARFALVKTAVPGASAESVETEVTEVIEERLQDVDAIRLMRSQSRPGISVIVVELSDHESDLEAAWAEVREKMELARSDLPSNAGRPELDKLDVRAYALILGLAWTSEQPVNRLVLQRQAEQLEELLLGVEGTEEVEIFGASPEELTVHLDRRKLQRQGLSLNVLAERFAAQEARSVGGELIGERNRYVVKTDTRFDSVEEIRSMPLLRTESGGYLTVESLGRVERGPALPLEEKCLISGRTSVVLGVYAKDQTRVDLWMKNVEQAMAAWPVPDGMELVTVFDQSRTVQSRLGVLAMNLALAVAGVMLVILFMMGARAALVVGTAIPLTSACVLGAMVFLGIPIHQMSVTGLIVALGLLIDNAIVVTDELKAERDAGHGDTEAIVKVVKRLTVPLASSTATTVFAFLPIALLPGGTGEFVGTIAMTVIIALISSLALSLTVLPVIFTWLMRAQPGRPNVWTGPGLVGAYRWLLRHPFTALALALVGPVMGFLSMTALKEQFFPPTDRDQIRMVIELPNSRTLEATEELAHRIRQVCLENPRVKELHWFLGRNVPKFYYNLNQNREREPFFGEALVVLDGPEQTGPLIRGLQKDLETRFPEARPRVIQLEQGPPFEAPVELHLFGADLETQRQAGEILRLALSRHPDVVSTRATLSDDLAQMEMQLDTEQVRLAGLEPEQVASFLGLATHGRVVGSVFEDTEKLPVRLRLADAHRSQLDELRSLQVETAQGPVPLASLVEWDVVPQRALLTHRHQRRCNTVQAFLAAGTLPASVLQPLLDQLESGELKLPRGITYEIGGEAAERNRAVGNLLAYVAPLMVLMVGSLVVAFRSFRLAFLVGAVALMSAGAGFGTLALLGIPFGFMAIIGTMGLLGVSINDSTVVLTILQEEAPEGDLEHVAQTMARATRHVIATTFTTVAGFLPLLFGADRFWHPLAATISGGVVGATFLALVMCPVVYRWLRPGRGAGPSGSND